MSDDYEDLTQCWLDDDDVEALLEHQTECIFMWTTRAGEPFGVVMSYVWRDGRFWLTCARRRKRVPAIERDPRVAICVNSTGSEIGGGKTVTWKGTCVVRDDRETKDWFYPALAQRVRPADPTGSASFEKFLDSPDRVILEVEPTSSLSFDSAKMMARSPEAARKETRAEMGLD